MYDDDDTTFSLVSTASVTDATSVTTRTELEHADDDIDFGVDDATSDFESGWEVSSGPSTSVPPSVYEDEIAYGRRYHGFRRGIYPMPNDEVERHREETVHALFLQLMVRSAVLRALAYGARCLQPRSVLPSINCLPTWVMECLK
jgi:hypothetical protein